jgi:predicted RNase H-like HicB family nuclease
LVATEEEGEFVSTCPELGIASQGATVEEAFANLKDATLTYLRTIEDLGERDRIFKERRIKIWAGNPDVGTVRLKLAPQQFGATFAAPVRRNSERKATHAKSR